jgi:hypothetical protein
MMATPTGLGALGHVGQACWRGWATPTAREKGERGGRAGSAEPRPWRAVATLSATRGEEEGMERGRGVAHHERTETNDMGSTWPPADGVLGATSRQRQGEDTLARRDAAPLGEEA